MSMPQPQSASGLVQFIRTLYLAIRLFFNPNVPAWTKLVPLAALLYVIFPMDFLPDLIPGLGQLDDLGILLVALWAFVQLCPVGVVRDLRGDSEVVDAEYRMVNDDEPARRPQDEIPSPDRPKS